MKDNPSQSVTNTDRPLDGLDIPFLEEQNNYVGGVVVDQSEYDASNIDANKELWKLNIVLALVSCWIAVSLTGWGTVQLEEGKRNKIFDVSKYLSQVSQYEVFFPEIVNVWFIIFSQWLAMGLYAWTLAAPLLFPDRDFS